jgi:hypothetical protein
VVITDGSPDVIKGILAVGEEFLQGHLAIAILVGFLEGLVQALAHSGARLGFLQRDAAGAAGVDLAEARGGAAVVQKLLLADRRVLVRVEAGELRRTRKSGRGRAKLSYGWQVRERVGC